MFTISMVDYQKNKNYVSIFAWKYFIYIALKLLSKIKFFIKLLFINLSLFISSISFSSICFYSNSLRYVCWNSIPIFWHIYNNTLTLMVESNLLPLSPSSTYKSEKLITPVWTFLLME